LKKGQNFKLTLLFYNDNIKAMTIRDVNFFLKYR